MIEGGNSGEYPQGEEIGRISTPVQETEAPVKDAVSHFFGGLYHAIGKATETSRIRSDGEQSETPINRSLLTRSIRAELLQRIHAIPHADRAGREKIIQEAHEWDRLAKDFLKQGSVHVTLPGLGEQTARYNVLTPTQVETESAEKPPIVLIPGISNDLDCIATMAQTLAFSGRKVISIGYPESHMGNVTEDFAKAVVEGDGLTKHAEFYTTAIESLTSNVSDVEVWGVSTGCPILAEILSKPDAQEKFSNAVFIAPAGSVTQSTLSMNLGVARELPGIFKGFGKVLPRYVLTQGRKEGADENQLGLHKKIFNSLYSAITQESPFWKTMKVREGGNIVIINGGKDQVTKSYKAVKLFEMNPQVKVATLPNISHVTSFTNPEVLEKVSDMQTAS